jgi:hypothetical protein
MKNFVTSIFLILVLNMSICLKLKFSVFEVSNETQSNSTKPNNEVSSLPNNENLSGKCKYYNDAVKLNLNLEKTVKQLYDLIKDHANMSLSRAANLYDVDNSYSKFPVNSTISYKKFLEDVHSSYVSGFYNNLLKKLSNALNLKKFPSSLKQQCSNFIDTNDSTVTNTTNKDHENNENKNSTSTNTANKYNENNENKNSTSTNTTNKNHEKNENKNSTSTNTSNKDDEDKNSNFSFLQNKSKLKNTNNLKKMNLMTLKDLYNEYCLLLEKSKKLLI